MPFRSLLVALAALLVIAPGARAAWFAAEPVDGPSPDIAALGGIDVARDATGGLVYLKNVDGVPHVFLSRLVDGTWRAPERVDTGIDAGASDPVIAAADDHRLAIAWLADGRVWGSVAAGGPPQPLPAPALLYGDRGATAPDIDVGINGNAYVVFRAPGDDIRAVRLAATTWEAVPGVLDVAPEQPAGRPRVAVAADGNAVAVWEEAGRLRGRRVTRLTPSQVTQDISLPEFEGVPGGPADALDIDIEEDGSWAWVVFRQQFDSRPRAIARRLVGSAYEAPAAIDGGSPADLPRVAISGRGVGVGAVGDAANNAVKASLLERDVFGPSLRVDTTGSGVPSLPVVAASDGDEQMVAWRSGAPGAIAVRARRRPEDSAYEPEQVISTPEFGSAGSSLEAANDRTGNFHVAFLQGPDDGRRVVTATFDEPPGTPRGLSTTNFQRAARPTLKWSAGLDLLGRQRFRVTVDGAAIAETTATELVVPTKLAEGPHTWHVTAVDQRGQETVGPPRIVRVDPRAPGVRVRVRGRRRAGRPLRIRVSAFDRGGAGVKSVSVSFGDGTRRSGRRHRHVYARPGRYRLLARAVDRAGNVRRKSVRLRIRG